MKVELIGTGSFTTKSNNACSLVNQKILVDIPNGTTKILEKMGKSIYLLQTVIITHFHGDHYFDLPFLLLEKSFEPEKNIKPFYIIGPKGIEEKTIGLMKMAFPDSWEKVKEKLQVKFVEMNPKDIKYVEDLTIEAVEVDHQFPNSQGYILTIDNQKCAFTGDTSACEGVEYLLGRSKILVADCSWPEGIKTHMGIDNIKEYLEKYPSNIIIGTHMQDQTKEEAHKQEIENFIIPEDGYTLEF